MNKKNILLITPYSLKNYGGVQNQIQLIKKLMPKEVYDVKIFAHGSEDYNNKSPFSVNFNGSKSNVSIRHDRDLLKKAIKWADIIHIHEPFIPFVLWRLKTDKPIITTHHASLNIFWSLILRILYLSHTKKSSIVNVCVSDLAYNQASALRRNPIIIPNCIKLNNEVTFNRDATRIMFLGRDEKRKGLRIFINSIDSYIINKLKPTVISNRHISNVYIDSYIDLNNKNKLKLLKNTKIFIAPNIKNESFGIILLEAIANGAVVIASNIKPFKNVLKNSGIYFTSGSSKDLNEVIKETLNKDMELIWNKQYKQLLQYDSNKVLPELIELYNK